MYKLEKLYRWEGAVCNTYECWLGVGTSNTYEGIRKIADQFTDRMEHLLNEDNAYRPEGILDFRITFVSNIHPITAPEIRIMKS